MTPKDKLVALAKLIVDHGGVVDEREWNLVVANAKSCLESVKQEKRTSDAARKGFYGDAEKSES
jgi:hypothetical protein